MSTTIIIIVYKHITNGKNHPNSNHFQTTPLSKAKVPLRQILT